MPNKPLRKDAWAIPPSPLMLKHSNDYYTCSKCGEKVDVVDLKEATPSPVYDNEWFGLVEEWPLTIAPLNEGTVDELLLKLARSGVKHPEMIDNSWPPLIEAKAAIQAKITEAYEKGKADA